MRNIFISHCRQSGHYGGRSWHVPLWRHEMETFSALLAICAGNSPVPGEFPAQRPVTRSFDVYFDLRLNKRLSNQSWGWWFGTSSRPLWRHCNEEYPKLMSTQVEIYQPRHDSCDHRFDVSRSAYSINAEHRGMVMFLLSFDASRNRQQSLSAFIQKCLLFWVYIVVMHYPAANWK